MPPSISDSAAPPESAPDRRFRWPADYYAGPTPDAVLPRWVSFGCGAASLVVILIVFIVGGWLSRGGFATFLDLAAGMTLGEARGMFTSDVTAAHKEAFEKEMAALREQVRSGQTPANNLALVLQTLQKAMADKKVNGREVGEVTEAARKARQRSRNVSWKLQSLKVAKSQRSARVDSLRLCDSATLRL